MTRRRLGAATTTLRAVEADRNLADVLNRVVEGIERERTEPQDRDALPAKSPNGDAAGQRGVATCS